MKTWTRASIMTVIAICIAVGTALATQWIGSSGYDEMQLLGDNDLIHTGDGNDTIDMSNGNDTIATRTGDDTIMTGWGADEINLGPSRVDADAQEGGFDVISFYDGNAALVFHDATQVPTNSVRMEYLESDESLTVYAAADFVISID